MNNTLADPIHPLNVLLCNDDGIQAPGIRALHDAIQDLVSVRVVAPDGERSAIAQAITLTKPLFAREWPSHDAPFGTAISGTPADCVKLAANCLCKQPPDLVLSGINLGPNAGISLLYSGTVAVATEAVIMGIPAMAISLNTFTNPLWDTAARVSRAVLGKFIAGELRIGEDCFWNINIPNLPYNELKGIRITRMGASRFIENYEPRLDPFGRPYYWMRGELKEMGDTTGTDLEALRAGYVSLSPIGLDRTRSDLMSTPAPTLP